MTYMTLETAPDYIGVELISNWIEITQERINLFGQAIDDHDPHHIDPDFAKEHSPHGKTIAFGWLTTSLTTPMLYDVFRYRMDGDPVTYGYPLSYGFNRMRLLNPVPVDSRIRGRIVLSDITPKEPGKTLYTFDMVVEIENVEKPALAAQYLFMWLRDPI